MIEVSHLKKTFSLSRQQKREMGPAFSGSTVDAVSDVSFSCRPGRIFCLLGPNGAGKTTTLRILATMLKPTAGTVTVNGFDVVREANNVRRTMGFLTNATALYDRLTPSELVAYYARLHGMSDDAMRARRERLFETLGIDEFAGRRIAKLSTGMKQKVSIVRTMIHDPQVLILDEATAGLDVIAGRGIIDLVRAARNEGKTVIFSTHRMDEVSLLADDLAIMHRGRMLYSGAFDAFKQEMRAPSLEDEFILRIEAGSAPDVDRSPRLAGSRMSPPGG